LQQSPPDDVIVAGHRPLEILAADTSFVGTKSVTVQQFGYDTADSSYISGAYLGNISLKLEGDFTRHADGSWDFEGEVRAYDDTYDFNPSTHRDWWEETFTNAMELLPGSLYDIGINGSIPVEWHSEVGA
jgi:hypothetical protein